MRAPQCSQRIHEGSPTSPRDGRERAAAGVSTAVSAPGLARYASILQRNVRAVSA